MAYTKTTWNTGDVITAEKLNHMEDGITSAQIYNENYATIFSDNVTVESDGDVYFADINCDLSYAPEQINVNFDNTEYTCEKVVTDEGFGYGTCLEGAPDFSMYPFFIVGGNPSTILTETGNTHQLEISATAKTMNQDLVDALKKLILVVDVVVAVGDDSTASVDSQEVVKTLAAGGIVVYRAAINGRIGVSWIPYAFQGGNIYLSVQSTNDYQHYGKVLIYTQIRNFSTHKALPHRSTFNIERKMPQ